MINPSGNTTAPRRPLLLRPLALTLLAALALAAGVLIALHGRAAMTAPRSSEKLPAPPSARLTAQAPIPSAAPAGARSSLFDAREVPLTPSAPVTAAPISPDTGIQPPKSGFFLELPGRAEAPVIRVYTDARGIHTLALVNSAGVRYQTSFASTQPSQITVPPGTYRAVVWSDDPTVSPNRGEATFRRFKEYEARFTTVPEWLARPLQLGDR